MKLARRLLISASLFVMSTGVASAVPVTFQLDNVIVAGNSSQIYDPVFPLVGSGDIDFGAGTGSVMLPDYSIVIDVGFDGDDARLDITGWSQTINSIDVSGSITSTGSGTTACTDLGGLGVFVCQLIDANPTIPGWPPTDVEGQSPSSALIDTGLQTITVIDNSSPAAGTITQFYSYTIVPEPGTALLLLAGLGVMARRRS